MRRRVSFQTILTVVVLCMGTQGAYCNAQPILLESAQLGSTGQVSGTAIGIDLYYGWRFTTSVPVAVEQVGGHMYAISIQPGDIFAALVLLPTIDSSPAGHPFTETEVVAKTTFRPSSPSVDYLTPLSATLIPGSYALVFGSGQFDTIGGVAMVNTPDQPYIPPTTMSSYISWRVISPGSPAEWLSAQVENMRFVLVGQETSFTADFEGDGDVDGTDLTIWQGAYGTNALGDADGDTDSDGADFLAWQRQYTGTGEAMTSQLTHLLVTPVSTVVPEPGAFTLLGTFAIAFAARRYTKYSFPLNR